MTTNRHSIDELFKRSLEGALKSPPPYVWDKINASLNSKRHSRRVLYYWLAAASFALIIGFSTGYYFAVNKNRLIDNKNRIAENNIIEKHSTDNDIKLNQNTKSEIQVLSENKTQASFNDSKIQRPIVKEVKNDINKTTGINNSQLQINPHSTPKAAEKPAAIPGLAEIETSGLVYVADLDMPENQFTEKNKKFITNRLSIVANGSPVIAYRNIQNLGSNFYELMNSSTKSLAGTNQESDKNYFNSIETPKVTYSAGISIDYLLNKNMSISGGLNLSNYGYNSMEIFVLEDNNTANNRIINSSAGDVLISDSRGSLQDELDTHYLFTQNLYGSSMYLSQEAMRVNLSYIEIPFGIKYSMGKNKQKFFINAGLAPSVFTSGKAVLTAQKVELGKIDKIKDFNTIVYTGFGYSSSVFNDNFRIFIEPRFRYMLNPVSKLDYIRSYHYSYSLTTGLIYTF